MAADNLHTTEYRIKMVDSIIDNVHGFIGLTEVECEIEKLPIFKRLQNISQLGLTSRVFPCALHNRYIHSLGVMHIVDQMATRLEFSDDARQIIRLAGMLHDIGHYPFSHDVETAYDDAIQLSDSPSEEFSNYATKARETIKNLTSPQVDVKFFLDRRNSELHHESIGETVISNSANIKKLILEKYINKTDYYSENYNYDKSQNEKVLRSIILDICAIIVGDSKHKSEFFPKEFGMMVQIMHSELDADRIDYLLRDATFSGISYGAFDFGVLIQNLDKMLDPDSNEYIVGVTIDGIGCAEQYLLNRYFAYSQVIHHKYTSILGCALQSVVKWLISDDESGFPDEYKDVKKLAENHENDALYIGYTDAFLMDKINRACDNANCPEQIKRLARCIKEYELLAMSNQDDDEFICSGIDESYISEKIENSNPFIELGKTDGSIQDVIYRYSEMRLTKHIPHKDFEERLNKAVKPEDGNTEDGNTEDKSDFAENLKADYRSDRLQDGLVIVEPNNPGSKPKMLIDSDRSMLRDIYNLRYCVLRRYSIPKL